VGDLALGDFALGDFSYWAISPGGQFLLLSVVRAYNNCVIFAKPCDTFPVGSGITLILGCNHFYVMDDYILFLINFLQDLFQMLLLNQIKWNKKEFSFF